MSDKSKEVETKLKQLKEKDLPKNVKESIDKKLEYINKPFHK